MLFNSGDPSLTSYARDKAGDPSEAAAALWTDAKVQAAINDAYLELREQARVHGEGAEVKRSYSTTVADQLWYEYPDDFKRLVLAEVDTSGVDLTTAASNSVVLKPLALDTAMEGNETGAFSGVEFIALGDEHFAIVAPVSTGGSNSLRITYEADSAALSNDTDEPIIPLAHQYLICYKAAVSLRAAENLEHNDLLRLMIQKERLFNIAMQDRMNSNEDQVAVAGLVQRKHLTRFGRAW